MFQKVRWVGAALALSAGLAACSGSASPNSPSVSGASTHSITTTQPRLTPSVTTSPSATTSQVYDPVPEAARQHTTDGALAFAQFWADQYIKGFTNPQPGMLSRFCQPGLPMCEKAESAYLEIKRKGYRASGPVGEMRDAEVIETRMPGTTRVAMLLDLLKYDYVDASGKVVESSPPYETAIGLDLMWAVNGWTVAGIMKAAE